MRRELNSVVSCNNIPFSSSWMSLASSPTCVGLIHSTSQSHLVSTMRKEKITYNLKRFIFLLSGRDLSRLFQLKIPLPFFFTWNPTCSLIIQAEHVCVHTRMHVCSHTFLCFCKGNLDSSILRNRKFVLQVLRF